MAHILVGLGNPDNEYKGTRHNIGRDVVEAFVKANDFGDWRLNKKLKAFENKGEVGKNKVTAVLAGVYMNESGKAVANYVKSVKAAEKLIVVQDDLDLPLGVMKISFGRGSGGHRGIDSIMRSLKTKNFVRIRLGISSETAGGKLKKPSGEEAVVKHVLGKWKPSEEADLKKIKKNALSAILMVISEGRESAMGMFN